MSDIIDDYVIIGASGDNFNCNSTNGWTKGGNAGDATTQDNRVEGAKSLGLTTSDKNESWWYHDISSNRFKITQKDLGLWFYYIKGKGDNVLVQNDTAIIVRLYFGGTSKYADYKLTKRGDKSLAFGWQMLMCSGKETNGGGIGGGHNNSSDWNLDIYRFEFRLNCANKAENPLGLDAVFAGTKIEIIGGSQSSPIDAGKLEEYTFDTRPDFPIGTVEISGRLANIKSGLKINNGGYFRENNMYLLFNQYSNDVKHNLEISDGTFRVGTTTNDKAYNGCQIVKPIGKNADLIVGINGIIELYNSKVYRWKNIILEGSITTSHVDFDSNNSVIYDSDNVQALDISVHDAINITDTYAMTIGSNPALIEDVSVYRCTDGIRFTDDSTVIGAKLTDNSGYDINIQNNSDPSIVDGLYSTIRRI